MDFISEFNMMKEVNGQLKVLYDYAINKNCNFSYQMYSASIEHINNYGYESFVRQKDNIYADLYYNHKKSFFDLKKRIYA